MNSDKKPPVVLETPCKECPWRLSNQGKPHPDGWYTTRNLRRLWSKLRKGEQMSCHRTDPNNEISEKARAAGVKEVLDSGRPASECAGAVVLVQRELMRAQDAVLADKHDKGRYRRENKLGLTAHGIMAVLERALFGPLSGGGAMPDLNQGDLGAPWLATWTPRVATAEEARIAEAEAAEAADAAEEEVVDARR